MIFFVLILYLTSSMHLFRLVFFIYISLMTNDIENFFMYLLAISISFLERLLFKSFAHFLFELFVFLLLNRKGTLYILYTRPLSDS